MCKYCKICYDKKTNSAEALYFEKEGIPVENMFATIFYIKN